MIIIISKEFNPIITSSKVFAIYTINGIEVGLPDIIGACHMINVQDYKFVWVGWN
jgi:hypothetical protein